MVLFYLEDLLVVNIFYTIIFCESSRKFDFSKWLSINEVTTQVTQVHFFGSSFEICESQHIY